MSEQHTPQGETPNEVRNRIIYIVHSNLQAGIIGTPRMGYETPDGRLEYRSEVHRRNYENYGERIPIHSNRLWGRLFSWGDLENYRYLYPVGSKTIEVPIENDDGSHSMEERFIRLMHDERHLDLNGLWVVYPIGRGFIRKDLPVAYRYDGRKFGPLTDFELIELPEPADLE